MLNVKYVKYMLKYEAKKKIMSCVKFGKIAVTVQNNRLDSKIT